MPGGPNEQQEQQQQPQPQAGQQGDKLLNLEEMTKLVNGNRKVPQKEEEDILEFPEFGM